MARPESVALAGFYPTPDHLLPHIANKLVSRGFDVATVLDPCAGEGVALGYLRDHLVSVGETYYKDNPPKYGTRQVHVHVKAVEMEQVRHSRIPLRDQDDSALHGDFFTVPPQKRPVSSVLFLNPPYDFDKLYKRLEEKFLVKALPFLSDKGVLIYIIPEYAVDHSLATLRQNFDDLRMYRFPEPDYSVYKQVVIFGIKKDAVRSSPFDTCPIDVDDLVGGSGEYVVPFFYHRNATKGQWHCTPFDYSSLDGFDPWNHVDALSMNEPDDLLTRRSRSYPVASVLRPVHLSAALSAGIFNGVHVKPSESYPNFPEILVKGSFDREWVYQDDKVNSKGEVTSVVEVQKPKLNVCILDLITGKYHTVIPSVTLTAPQSLDTATTADLLEIYGQGLLTGMIETCPILHDPRRDVETPITMVSRPLFKAQQTAAHTLIKILAQPENDGAILLGEIGSGKTCVSLATLAMMGKRRILVLCPPHLLEGWSDQISEVVPQYKSFVLESISDVKLWNAYEGMSIGLLSREKAKLGHGWLGLDETGFKTCPKCGTIRSAIHHKTNFAKGRVKCDTDIYERSDPSNPYYLWAMKWKHLLGSLLPDSYNVQMLFSLSNVSNKWFKKQKGSWGDRDTVKLVECMSELFQMTKDRSEDFLREITFVCPELVPHVLSTHKFPHAYKGWSILLNLATLEGYDADSVKSVDRYHSPTWESFKEYHESVMSSKKSGGLKFDNPSYSYMGYDIFKDWSLFRKDSEGISYLNGRSQQEVLSKLVTNAISLAGFKLVTCDERLYQATAPCRYPLAKWINKFLPDCYDSLIIDEAHEYSSEGSAQTNAMLRLQKADVPKLLLTGSVNNGYAESTFEMMRVVSSRFRKQYGKQDRGKFIDRYGYWKRIRDLEDRNSGDIIDRGTNTDRYTRAPRKAGVAPGILPLFLLDWLLYSSATLQKEDLEIAIPPSHNRVQKVTFDSDMVKQQAQLKRDLKDANRLARKNPLLCGKLWGAFGSLVSYPDKISTGDFEIRWPDSDDMPSNYRNLLISSVPQLPGLTNKEKKLIDTVRSELAEGRKCMIFVWNTELISRVVDLVGSYGKVVRLDSSKVPTAKRQSWINKNVVAAKADILVTNPVCIQTGLNNLVYFSTIVWFQNPQCHPNIYRQAEGRIDRINQREETRMYFIAYASESLQDDAHSLLLHKVGVARSVDGLDPESALQAAGVGEMGEFSGYSMGRELYRRMMFDES